MKKRTKKTAGLSLVEVLIAMVILGALLGMLGSFFAFNERMGSAQITAAKVNNDVRLAFLRLSDVTAQAQYIYPAEQTFTFNGPTFDATLTTGANALAILVPSNTTYCPATTPASYCGFAFSIEAKNPYTAILGSSSATTGFVLAEYRFTGLDWPGGENSALPSTTWQDSSALRSPLVDSVDRANSSLAAPGDLEFASYSSFDERTFTYPTSADPAYLEAFGTQANALVKAVNSNLALEYTIRGSAISAQRDNFVFARAIPRNRQPE